LGYPFALWDEISELGKCLCVAYFDPEKNQTCCYHYKYWKGAWPGPKADGWDDWYWWQ
jgi:hypothetical protein